MFMKKAYADDEEEREERKGSLFIDKSLKWSCNVIHGFIFKFFTLGLTALPPITFVLGPKKCASDYYHEGLHCFVLYFILFLFIKERHVTPLHVTSPRSSQMWTYSHR